MAHGMQWTKKVVYTVVGIFAAALLWQRLFRIQDELTYRDVISYFVTQRPSSASKGIVVRKSGLGGTYTVSQLFLDNRDEIMVKANGSSYGRELRVRRLDSELLGAFGDEDVIVVT
jgi:hypothetical protein